MDDDTILIATRFTLENLPHSEKKARMQRIAVCEDSLDEEMLIGNRKIRFMFAPGHTRGHMMVLDVERNIVYGGDHVVGYGTCVLDSKCGSMSEYLQTCNKILEMKPLPSLIVPSHGKPSYQVAALIQMYVNHRLQRERQILGLVEQGQKDPMEIVKAIYPDPNTWPFARVNVDHHLEKLKLEGKL